MHSNKKLTTEQLIERAKIIFPDYDYSLVKAEDRNDKFKIICPEHGVFQKSHKAFWLHKRGCPTCVRSTIVLGNEKFIKRAKAVHGNNYDYSLVEYTTYSKKVRIICRKHGVFEQKPNNHITGYGCHFCGKENPFTLKHFIDKANSIHGFRYDYSQSIYVNQLTPIKIKCKIHGAFEQTPITHMGCKIGCPTCASTLLDTETFIQLAKKRHNNFFDYSKAVYSNSKTKVEIVCPSHGSFLQEAGSHLAGISCKKCKYEELAERPRSGWTASEWAGCQNGRPATLYVIKCTSEGNTESFIKVGITLKRLSQRFSKFPYKYEPLALHQSMDATFIWQTERELKRQFKKHKHRPTIEFGGQHECFTVNQEKQILKTVETFIKHGLPLSLFA